MLHPHQAKMLQDNAWLLFDSDVCVAHDDANDMAEPADPGYETDAERPQDKGQQQQKEQQEEQSTDASSPDTTSSAPADFTFTSASLPFGQHVPLAAIRGPAYLTAQSLIQQVAFSLSDKIFSYSPETFDLDISIKSWRAGGEKNVWGYETGISSLQTRTGAGQIALGYIFSKDFDLSKRHVPQTIVASSAALPHLRPALDQLSLLYDLASPVVAHVSAADYSAAPSAGLVTDYVTAMAQAEDLGLGLVASTSTFEAQHMSLLATLMATAMPALHIYDGVNVGRETTRVADVLDQPRLRSAWDRISREAAAEAAKALDGERRLVRLLDIFNEELDTDYKPFEYYGHAEPEAVLVVFGSVEGSIAAQLAFALSNNGVRVGAVNVRVYRPFAEAEFVDALPASARTVAVLGQVAGPAAVADAGERSLLYRDVLAALALGPRYGRAAPRVVDVKYAREEVWTPSKLLYVFQHIEEDFDAAARRAMDAPDRPRFDLLGSAVTRYTFWDVDDAATRDVPTVVGKVLSQGPAANIQVRSGHDNLVQGGVVRTDVRSSAKSIEAPYSISNSNVTFVGAEALLATYDVVGSLQPGGRVLVRLPNAKAQDADKVQKRLPAAFRAALADKQCALFLLDPAASPSVAARPELEGKLAQLAFLGFAWDEQTSSEIGGLAAVDGDATTLQALSAELDAALWRVEGTESWSTAAAAEAAAAAAAAAGTNATTEGEVEEEQERPFVPALPTDINTNSFVAFDKSEPETPGRVGSWIAAAKGLAFKEATGTRARLRPDLAVRTAVVHVKERRRLTPPTYDRNIFHIEFDLGTSGVTYKIGEALGIHPENDESQVREFIAWYGLAPSDVVEVPSREDPSVLESRTVLQSLLQNVDIFGRPPKRFYEQLAEYATDEAQAKDLLALGTGSTAEGAQEFKRRAEVDTITYADILLEYSSAHPPFADVVRMVAPIKRREYSIASSQRVTPTAVSLLIVTVGWVDPQGRDRFGQATRYLNSLAPGSPVTVSVKPSVMKLPAKSTAPLIMAGLGTGLAPFRAFVQERAWQRQQGEEIGEVLLYMGSRHQREEYLYGEEWEAYQDAGVITLLGRAFSRDQPAKVYIQDRMRESLAEIRRAYLQKEGSFYLCGPTWPVPDVTEVLQEAVEAESAASGGKKVDGRKEIERMKEAERYVLEVY